MKPLFYLLLVPTGQGQVQFGGAFASRDKAEAKAASLNRPYRIQAVNPRDLGGGENA